MKKINAFNTNKITNSVLTIDIRSLSMYNDHKITKIVEMKNVPHPKNVSEIIIKLKENENEKLPTVSLCLIYFFVSIFIKDFLFCRSFFLC